jgi:hypothetical protein
MRRRVLTTVASWESTEGGTVVDGVAYGGKNVEFERFLGLARLVDVPLEIALSGKPPRERMEAEGWQVIDPYPVSRDPWVYRDYLASSLGEWSVAKNAYAASRSGWFSCRTACYLALGVPAVVQDTGFSAHLPVGEGLFAFDTVEEAVEGIERVRCEPERHARAAAEIVEQHFESGRILRRMIAEALA